MFKEVSTKVDFPAQEAETIKYWNEKKILAKYLQKNNQSKKIFSFIDGPITANNPMGVHHAWGRTYKDLWQRFFNMRGYRERFQNGFDEQGLWVEVEVEKELDLHVKKDIENLVPGNVFESIAKFVNLCKERVKKYSGIQTEQSKRLGYFMDWDNSYHTSSDENNYSIWHYLKNVHEKGWLYKGHDTVPWCPRCGTAISQHEILTEEYKEVVHKAVYFKLPIIKGSLKGKSLLVWTTTPWTILGNVAVAIHPDKDYVITDENLIVMKERLKDLGLKAVKTIHGKSLLGLAYTGPFDSLPNPKKHLGEKGHLVINGEELVTENEGTGLVHIAPSAGEEDFKLSKEFNLPVIELIDEEASYIEGFASFSGKNGKKHPELILDYLKDYEDGKFFYKDENYKHRYPTCWRCKTELVWRVVDEWYIAMDKKTPEGMTYREMMKKAIKDVNWVPEWGYDRELDWLNNMHDWLISKKRYWGLALPIWECSKCHHFEVIGSHEDLEKRASSGFDKFKGNSPHRPWIDQVKINCEKCGAEVSRIADVGNPWLDAGIVPYSTLKYFEDKSYWEEWFPATFITESFPGQFKNWFYSLIAMSSALTGKAPFKTLLGHGSVRDEKGEEMHKSKGNAIWFDDAAEKMGVDTMRWLYLKVNPENNVNFGYQVADEVRRYFHIRLWNVYAFFVNYARLDGFTPSLVQNPPKNALDTWILSRLSSVILTVQASLEKFDAAVAVEAAEKFVVDDLSNWYVRRIRDRVGPTASPSEDKNQAYQTLWEVLVLTTKMLAPFIPFMTEEMYRNLTEGESVHLEAWPESPFLIDNDLEEAVARVMYLASVTHASRKEQNIKVRQPLNKITYSGTKLSEELEKLLAEEVNVKEVVYQEGQKEDVILDTVLTDYLKTEGEVRELVRQIQEARKNAGCTLNELVKVELPSWPRDFEDFIKKETLSSELKEGTDVKIIRA